ncbi:MULTISPECIES: anthrone oxygenase family protein [unclassified Streptomyces]|uniref:anthrone oxygenase family protein n=1 Tax=unclassified Streptomyces TaxID=2593676 RepID=UPI0037FB4E00
MTGAELLGVLVLLGNGIAAGVLFAVALSVVPAMAVMPADRYVYVHQLLGRNWDPTMPAIVLLSALLDTALAVLADDGTRAGSLGTAALLLVAVSWVSHFRNVPLNRRVKALDPGRLPADWSDPRPVWRRWHLARTTLAVAALALNALALAT